MKRSTLRAATAIAITLSFVLPAVDAAAVSPNASTGIYSAGHPNLLLVGGKKHKGHKKGHRQRGHKSSSRSRSRTVVVNNDYGHDHHDGNAGAALVTGLIVGAAVGAAVNESASN
jgi:hypothetical protein